MQVFQSGEDLQIDHGPFRILHAAGHLIDLSRHEIRFLSVHGHLGQRLDFVFQSVEFQFDEFKVRFSAPVVPDPLLAGRQVVLERPAHFLTMFGRVLRIERGDPLLESPRILLHPLTRGRTQELRERIVGEQQSQEDPEQAIESFHLQGLERRRAAEVVGTFQVTRNPL